MNIWKRISLLRTGSITCLLALFRPASCSRNTARLLAQFTIICMPIVAVYSAHAAGLGQHPPQHHYEVDCQVFYTVPAETYLSLTLDDAIGFMNARTQDVASVITANAASSITYSGYYVIDEIIPPGPPRCAEGNSCQLVNGGYYCRSIDCQYMSAHILYSTYNGFPVQTRENSRPYMTGYGCALHEWGAQEEGCSIRLSGPGGTNGALVDVEPGKDVAGLRAEVTCYDSNNQPQPGISVTLRADVGPLSGGHSHPDDNRPKGDLGGPPPTEHILERQVTGPDGAVHFTFKAPKVAGDHTITANCDDVSCGSDTGKVWVGIKNLVTLDNFQYYVLVGDTPNHFDNHYLTQTGLFQVHVLSTLYSAQYPNNPLLHLNDASLERGGLLDISAPWSPPHFEHCRGTEIDVRANDVLGAIPSAPEHIAEFRTLARVVGADARFEIPRNSSGDLLYNLRHFHVRLLGEMPQCP
jgi:hypothetical protein